MCMIIAMAICFNSANIAFVVITSLNFVMLYSNGPKLRFSDALFKYAFVVLCTYIFLYYLRFVNSILHDI